MDGYQQTVRYFYNIKIIWKVIEKAFRRAALKSHPDKGGDPVVFKKLNDAYNKLIGHIQKVRKKIILFVQCYFFAALIFKCESRSSTIYLINLFVCLCHSF